jgi:uncharacterized RDD family membrane protein YckC
MNTTVASTIPLYASFGRRLVALILDIIIIGVLQSFVIVPVLAVLGLSFVPDIQNMENMDESQAVGMAAAIMGAIGTIWIISACISFFYFSLLESSKLQGTIGKLAMGVVVTDMEGNRISFGKAALRAIGRYVSYVILCIGFLMAAFTDKKQALHDMIASTLVMKKS